MDKIKSFLQKGGQITDQIKASVSSPPKITANKVLIVVAVVVFVAAGLYYYYFYLGPGSKKGSYKPNNEGPNNASNSNGGQSQAQLIMFYVDWCPHCKTAKPEWDAAKAQFDGTTKNGYKIEFSEHNCTTETPQISQLMKQYKVEGYPTIKLVKDGKVIDFDAKPTQDSIAQLINTAI